MVAAGGIGNLVDRTQLGYVRDFFEFTFMDFAIFNIADTFVTVGAIVLIVGLIVTLIFPSKDKRIPQDDDKDGEESVAEGVAEGRGKDGGVAFTVEAADSGETDAGAESPAAAPAEEHAEADGSVGKGAAFTVTEVGEDEKDESAGE